MSTLGEVRKEISDLTALLIEVGLSVEQNFPSEKTHVGNGGAVVDLSISNAEEIAVALKKRPYPEIYAALREGRAFNLRLIDGALMQFRYRFNGDNLLKHSLGFYPSPDLLEFQNYPDLYEEDMLYADLVQKDIVTTPIRFDFDRGAFVDGDHPMSHFTIGQYKNCRLPVAGALTPYRFVQFVLKSFYNTPFKAYCSAWKGSARDFPRTVTDGEAADLHLAYQ